MSIQVQSDTPDLRTAKIDRWLFWPAIVSVLLFAILTLVCGIPGIVGFLLIPLSIVGLPIAGITLLVAALVFAIRKHPRKAVSLLLAVIVPVLLWRPINRAADYIHFAMTVWLGAGYLGPAVKPDSHGFATYDWSVGLVTSPSTFLIRDDSDRIALPLNQRTAFPSSENGIFEECAGKANHLLGHYYICVF